jgi:CRP-like cAMP-binding protein
MGEGAYRSGPGVGVDAERLGAASDAIQEIAEDSAFASVRYRTQSPVRTGQGVYHALMTKSHAGARAHPRDNHLLASLSVADYEVLLPQLERIPMPLGMVVYESGSAQHFVYFPTDSIVSLLYVLESGASTEIAVTGNEGLVGISLIMGGESTPSRAVVQSAGSGYRVRGAALRGLFDSSGEAQLLLLRFTQALITQMTQTAVCNRHHLVDQQLCRWLLLSMDRLPSNRLMMTQELIANMLGVRREGVTEAAGKLQSDGLIEYSRGNITVLDRPRLEARVCECYAVVKHEYDRLLAPHSLPAASHSVEAS